MPGAFRKLHNSILATGRSRATAAGCKLNTASWTSIHRLESVLQAPCPTSTRPLIHLLDDDQCLLRAYQCYLEQTEFEVRLFHHGREYLENIEDHGSVSAAVFDLRLAEEDMDGLMVLEQLRAWNYHYPVILLTGYGDADTKQRALRAGCFAVLQKPVWPDELVAKLKIAAKECPSGQIQ